MSHALQPWMERPDWAAGEVKSSDKKALAGLWFFAVVWNAVSAPALFGLLKKIQQNGEPMLWLVFLFPAVGVVLIIAAIRATIRFQKFGTSVFKMLSVPGVIGGSISGAVQTKTRLTPEDGFHLSLQSVQRVTTGSGKNRRTVERVLWEDKKVVNELQQINNRQTGIPVFFEIPERCAATSKAQSISWKLLVEAAVAGIDFKSEFEVPVFEVTGHKPTAVNPAEFAARYEVPIDHAAALAAMDISIRPAVGGIEILLPSARNKGMCILTLVLFLFAATGLAVAIVRNAFPLVTLVAGVFTLVIGLATVQLWLKSVRVIADKSGLTIWTRYFGPEKPVTLAVEEIADFEVKQSAQAGTTVYYEIKALTRRRPFPVAGMIKGRKEADWLAEQIKAGLDWTSTHDKETQADNS